MPIISSTAPSVYIQKLNFLFPSDLALRGEVQQPLFGAAHPGGGSGGGGGGSNADAWQGDPAGFGDVVFTTLAPLQEDAGNYLLLTWLLLSFFLTLGGVNCQGIS